MIINNLSNKIQNCHNLILTGAPGTGKTYLAKELARNLTDPSKAYKDLVKAGRIGFVQFHPSYDYSDFVEGLRPKVISSTLGFERKDGVFKAFCKNALNAWNKAPINTPKAASDNETDQNNKVDKYVFIIDEINRGEMSKIFGELFFSIDPGYRGEDGLVETQYQNLIDKNGTDEFKDGFYVPENVYIIGTMNDIDRSVESMDFAMRRRFTFEEILATQRESMLDDFLAPNADEAKIKIHNLNYYIENTDGLSSAYHIGPAYFLPEKKGTKIDFSSIWNNKLKGLLFEYLRGMPNAPVLLSNLKIVYDCKKEVAQTDSNGQLIYKGPDFVAECKKP